ncbi:putative exported protein [Aliivibrio wodanis]|uniref:Putative exported protein n=1 Tax=Aliivibrio wodanis TaxID=80852 RepID=A0A090IC57_9GAMM|nr:putative exported protein [Aliivibrio wodanis]
MKKTLLAAALMGIMGSASAADSDRITDLEKQVKRLKNESSWADNVKISGFGSVGVGKANNGAGYAHYTDERYDTNIDSILGLQFEFKVNDQAKVVTQISASGRYDWEVDVDSAYISYDFDGFTARAGKMKAPLFMFSDYVDVGYAYPMIRPSQEMYENIILSSYTGADILIPFDIGESTLLLQPFGGNSEIKERDSSFGHTKLDMFFGLTAHLYYDDWTFRTSYITAQTAVQGLDEITDPTVGLIATTIDDETASFIALGLQYDDGDLMLLAEATQTTVSGDFTDVFSAYALTGYRFGSVMPYVMVSHNQTTDNDKRDGTALSGLSYESMAYSLGSRWDFAQNVALKLDVTYADFGDTHGGKFSYNVDDNNQPIENDTFVYSATVDFVF